MAKNQELNDESPMPFGAHNGTPMAEVPAEYLVWVWNEGLHSASQEDTKRGTVARYIHKSAEAIEMDTDKELEPRPEDVIAKIPD